LPYLRDIAALEWQRLQTSIAGPHEAMDVDALAQVREGELPGLRFHHQPGAQLHASAYPILRIWVFCQQEVPSGQLDMDVGGERVLFYRIGTDTHMRRISAGEHAFLASLCDGGTFAAACEAAFAEEASFDVQAAFAVAVRNGVLTDFYL
jgi:hypothetical protein